MVKAVVHQAQESEDRFPAGPRALFKLVSSCNRFEELNK